MNASSESDYLNANTLKEYGLMYAGKRRVTYQQKRLSPPEDERDNWGLIASPGDVTSEVLWRKATPTHGWHFVAGHEEVLAPGMRQLARRIEQALENQDGQAMTNGDTADQDRYVRSKAISGRVTVTEEPGQVHAWPVVDLFLTSATDDRLKGLRRMIDVMIDQMQS